MITFFVVNKEQTDDLLKYILKGGYKHSHWRAFLRESWLKAPCKKIKSHTANKKHPISARAPNSSSPLTRLTAGSKAGFLMWHPKDLERADYSANCKKTHKNKTKNKKNKKNPTIKKTQRNPQHKTAWRRFQHTFWTQPHYLSPDRRFQKQRLCLPTAILIHVLITEILLWHYFKKSQKLRKTLYCWQYLHLKNKKSSIKTTLKYSDRYMFYKTHWMGENKKNLLG